MPSEETEMNITIRIAITFAAILLAAHNLHYIWPSGRMFRVK